MLLYEEIREGRKIIKHFMMQGCSFINPLQLKFLFSKSTSIKQTLKATRSSYLRPILIASSGEQETVSGQFGDLCCLLSRNQPESTRPRTWASAPSCSSWLATLSMFSRTPVPPALRGSQENQQISWLWDQLFFFCSFQTVDPVLGRGCVPTTILLTREVCSPLQAKAL